MMRILLLGALLVWSAPHAQESTLGPPDGVIHGTLKEPQLCCGAPFEGAAYRVVMFRSFDPIIVIRLELRSSGEWQVHTKTYDRQPTKLNAAGEIVSEPTKDPTAVVRSITQDEVQVVLDAFTEADFWGVPSRDPTLPGLDGADWVIEARIGDQYHFAERWSPRMGAVRELGELLISVSGEPLGDIY